MPDFVEIYDQFLSLIEDQNDRSEVAKHLSIMSAPEVSDEAFSHAQRDLVRVLKSRASTVLPTSWRSFTALEDGVLPSDVEQEQDEQLRRDWKEVMEDEGVFIFGRTPTWDEIDQYEHENIEKHYGTKGWYRVPGPDKRGVKPPHAPRQKPHGNEVGARKMIVRLLAHPRFRGKIAELARALGLPEDTLYRDMFTPELVNDEAYRDKLEALFRETFKNTVEQAKEGTGRAGENFKLSAAKGRGRRADEHQDPVVYDSRVYDDEASRLLAAIPDGGPLDERTRFISSEVKRFLRTKKAETLRRAMNKRERALNAARGKLTRLQNKNAPLNEILAAAQDVHDKADEFLFSQAALRIALQDNPRLAEALEADTKTRDFIGRHVNNALAFNGSQRGRIYSILNGRQGKEAAPGDRPWGPDEGRGTRSWYGVPEDTHLKVQRDLTEAGPPKREGRFEISRSPAAQSDRPWRRARTAEDRTADRVNDRMDRQQEAAGQEPVASEQDQSAAPAPNPSRLPTQETKTETQPVASKPTTGTDGGNKDAAGLTRKQLISRIEAALNSEMLEWKPQEEGKKPAVDRFISKYKKELSAITSDLTQDEINDLLEPIFEKEQGAVLGEGGRKKRSDRSLIQMTEEMARIDEEMQQLDRDAGRAGQRGGVSASERKKQKDLAAIAADPSARAEAFLRALESAEGGGGSGNRPFTPPTTAAEEKAAREAAAERRKKAALKPKKEPVSRSAAPRPGQQDWLQNLGVGGAARPVNTDSTIKDQLPTFARNRFPRLPGTTQPLINAETFVDGIFTKLAQEASGDKKAEAKLKREYDKLKDRLDAIKDQGGDSFAKAEQVFDALKQFAAADKSYGSASSKFLTTVEEKLARAAENLKGAAPKKPKGRKNARLPLPGSRLEPSQPDMGDGSLPAKTVSGSNPFKGTADKPRNLAKRLPLN